MWIRNHTVTSTEIRVTMVASTVISVRPRMMLLRMEETIRSLASVSIASSTAPTVTHMLMLCTAE